MLITTGADVAAQTRAYNQTLAENLTVVPAPHLIDDPPAIRAARARGEGRSPPPYGSNRARTASSPDAAGTYRCACSSRRSFAASTCTFTAADGRWGRRPSRPQLWRLATAAETAVVSVDYRLAPEHPYPAAPDDCEDAARWLIAQAAREFGTDRLTIGGESAGAHLSVVVLLRLGAQAGAFRAAQLTFGAYDLSMTPSQRQWGDRNLILSTPIMHWFCDQFLPGTDPEERRAPDISPLYADLTGLPPARFVVGTQDPLLDDSLFMAARWRAAGNDATLEVIAEAAHGFLRLPLEIAEREFARQEEYLAKAVAD
jgi:acetyl esterase